MQTKVLSRPIGLLETQQDVKLHLDRVKRHWEAALGDINSPNHQQAMADTLGCILVGITALLDESVATRPAKKAQAP